MEDISLQPQKIIVIYSSGDMQSKGTYVEISDIDNQQVSNSRPLSKQELNNIFMVSLETKEKIEVQDINRTILHVREFPLSISWIYPRTTFKIIMKEDIYIISGIQLLLMVHQERLYAYFIKKNNGMNTILYSIELPNITNGLVCLGKYQMVFNGLQNVIESAEKGFFETSFTMGSTSVIVSAKNMKPINRSKLIQFKKLKEII